STAATANIIKYVVLAGLAGILYFVLRSYSAYSIEVLSTKITEHINEKVHERAVALELSFYESPSYYDTLKRALDSGYDKPGLVVTSLIDILKNCLSLAAVASVLIVINWILLPLLALFIFPTLLVRLFYSKKLNALRIAQTPFERKSSYYSNLITTDTAAKEIRSYGLGQYLKKKFTAIRQTLVKDKLAITLKRTKLEIITTTLSYIGVFVSIGFISLKVITGETSTGDITLFLVAFPQAFGLLQNLAASISTVYQNSIYINSIFELLQLTNGLYKSEQPESIPDGEDVSIELQNVHFSYPHADKEAISGINIKIPSGKIVAIVGLNGAGKSTLIKLLCRLYDPTTGTIKYGGKDIRMFEPEEYKKQLGVVFQDFNRYSFTAGENIFFGNIEKSYNMEKIQDAAKKSGAAVFIEAFPGTYNTMMGRIFDDGEEVSIGQWQKIALARCFYSDARFLIFDEASSALDAVSEKELFESFRERIGNRGAVIISHRRSAILHADYIYVLSGGKIIEEGTDTFLMQNNGAYAALFNENTNTTEAAY
ncbi:MAG: ABC transporter ATP-binding protein, partial [Niabella sp.]